MEIFQVYHLVRKFPKNEEQHAQAKKLLNKFLRIFERLLLKNLHAIFYSIYLSYHLCGLN